MNKAKLKVICIVGSVLAVCALTVYFLLPRLTPRKHFGALGEAEVQTRRLSDAREIYERTVSYGGSHPEAYDYVLSQFEFIARKFPDTAYSSKAGEQIDVWNKRRNEAADKMLAETTQNAVSQKPSNGDDYDSIQLEYRRIIERFSSTAAAQEAGKEIALWETRKQEAARVALAEAKSFAATNPRLFEEVLGRFESVGREYFGTVAAEEAVVAMAKAISERRQQRETKKTGLANSLTIAKPTPSEWDVRLVTSERRRALMAEAGVPPASEDAVRRALRRFAKTQSTNGSWSQDNEFPVAMTSLVLLAFFANGETQLSDGFGQTVERGLAFLMNQASKSPYGKVPEYETPMTVCALAEAYGLTKDVRLVPAIRAGIEWMLSKQTTRGGWGYLQAATLPPGMPAVQFQLRTEIGTPDISITTWHIQALRTAHLVGFEKEAIEDSLDKAVAFISILYSPALKEFGYDRPGGGWQRSGLGALSMISWELSENAHVRSALARALESTEFAMGMSDDEIGELLKRGKSGGRWAYGYFFLTQAMYLHDAPNGRLWSQWRDKYLDALVKLQNADGRFSRNDSSGSVMDDAFLTLMLSVPYRESRLKSALSKE